MADTNALIGTELKTYPGSYFGAGSYFQSLYQTTDSIAVIFQAPEACDLTGMMAYCRSLQGTSPYYKFQLQGVDASGDPDGSNLAETAEFQVAVGDEAHAFTSAYTCTQGQVLCGRMVYSSGTISASHYAAITIATNHVKYNVFPYALHWNGSAWTGTNSYYPTMAIQTDVTDVDFGGVYNIPNTSREGISTSGDRFAQRIEIPEAENIELHVDGFRFCGNLESSAGADVIVGVWPETGAALATGTIDTGQQLEQMSTTPYSRDYMFTSGSATITSGSVFYIGFEHAGGGSGDDLSITYASPGGLNGLKSWPGGDAFYASKYASSSWTDDNSRRLMLNPILSSVHGTASGGGSTTGATMGVIG